MLHIDCKARMVVKLITDKWHVIFFAPDHNHDLVHKPSLKKFLRSHKGIPKPVKDFIALLHGCNLSSGRIMQLMNEFYGSVQLQFHMRAKLLATSVLGSEEQKNTKIHKKP